MKRLFYLLSISIFYLSSSGCSLAKYGINYTQTIEPRYANFEISDFNTSAYGHIKLVSYNIQFSKKIDQATSLLKTNPDLANADILVLQEMDEIGVEQIAQQLGYNYIYYPAVFHPIPKKNFGNAILSKWPIIQDNKIILSERNEKKLQRIAASATIDVYGQKIMIFSVHMQISIKPFMRSAQIKRILNSIPEDINYCIIAGDFNTFTKVGHFAVINTFEDQGFELATRELGWTYKHWYTANRKFSLDHIFTKGFNTANFGKVTDRSASDHIPIWVDLKY